MMGELAEETSDECLFPSFAHSVGFALGQLLLLMDRPEDLAGCLTAIHVAARSTLLSDAFGLETATPDGMTLASAALRVVRAWHEEVNDLTALSEAIAELQDVLEGMGVRYVSPPPEQET